MRTTAVPRRAPDLGGPPPFRARRMGEPRYTPRPRLAFASDAPLPEIIPRSNPKQACCDRPDIQTVDGDRICANCGVIAAEENIVSEVTFGETSAGAAMVQGGTVSEGQRHANTMGSALRRMGAMMPSKEQAEFNGKDEIRKLTTSLGLSQMTLDRAFSIYKLALLHSFIQGRRVRTVAAACVYVICRSTERNEILLMDLAEKIQVNVYELGGVYKAILKELMLDGPGFAGVKPVIEVEPLIEKFARKLEFGSQTIKVASDAVSILRRMKRDWIVTGRLPAGLCGACLILAARMNNFRRTVREIAYLLRVSNTTIDKRLEEFEQTEAGTMTVEQFRDFGHRLRSETDPPILRKQLEKEKRRELRQDQDAATAPIEISEGEDGSEDEASDSDQAPDRALGQIPDREPRRDADGFVIPEVPTNRTGTPSQGKTAGSSDPAQEPQQERRQSSAATTADAGVPIDPQLTEPVGGPSTAQSAPGELSSAGPSTAQPSPVEAPAAQPGKRKRGRPAKPGSASHKRRKTKEPRPIDDFDLLAERELEQEIEKILHDPDTIHKMEEQLFEAGQTRARLLAREKVRVERQAKKDAQEEERSGQYGLLESETIGEDEFEDDPDVKGCILSEVEVRIKETIWVTNNEEWLREKQARLLRKTLEEAGNGGAKKKRRKKLSRKRKPGDDDVLEGSPASSAADATMRMIKKKSRSSNINYDRLDVVYGREPTPLAGSSTLPTAGRLGHTLPGQAAPAAGSAEEIVVEEGEGEAQQAIGGEEVVEVIEEGGDEEVVEEFDDDDVDEACTARKFGIDMGDGDDGGYNDYYDDDGFEEYD